MEGKGHQLTEGERGDCGSGLGGGAYPFPLPISYASG